MFEINLGKYRKARVWVGELPEAYFTPIKKNCYTFVREHPEIDSSRIGALELFVPLGARFMYGLIGGEMRPDAKGHLKRELIDRRSLYVQEIALSRPDHWT